MPSYRWKRRAEGGEIQRCEVEPLPLVGEGSDNYAGDEMVTK
ncbi:type II secretion system protein D [Escherichia coli]|uniref:Type II secretion system protein D n=1 Tax=Escherichia coli TaxID=562 RepID=A0A376RDI1_ECOLX|nr:type II secretion system protein D [Escherichia coli]